MASPPDGVVLGNDPGPHALASDTSSASYAGQGGDTTDTTAAGYDAAPDVTTTGLAQAATTNTTTATMAAPDRLPTVPESPTAERVVAATGAVAVADHRDSLLPLSSAPSSTIHHAQMDMDLTAPSDTYDSRPSATASVSPHLADVGEPSTNSPVSASASASFQRQQVGHQIRRKPLSASSSVSSLAAARSSNISATSPLYALDLPKPDRRFDRSHSIDSPTLYEYPSSVRDSLPFDSSNVANLASTDAALSDSRRIPENSGKHQVELSDVLSEYDDLTSNGSRNSVHDQTPSTFFDVDDIGPKDPGNNVARDDDVPPMPPPKPTPPHLKLEKVDTTVADIEALSGSSVETPQQLNKPLPKSPGAASPFAALFGWGNPSPSGTEFSSIPSPVSPAKREGSLHAYSTPAPTDSLSGSLRSNGASGNPINYCESYLSTPPPTISPSVIQIAEMEDELKAISSELAASIRREMDLEDLVDRLQEQVNTNQTPGRRTSDYFSDSGYSSVKASEYDQNREEIEKITRKSEQEKATLRLELTNKVQDERAKRKALDQQIKELVEKTSQIDLVAMNSLDANGRLKELESTCEELRRKLAEERESKTNIEDLLSALKKELQGASNERDNLRDEIVPQLRARVEGLESEASEYANLTYESSKMQQELQTLKQENTNLRRTSKVEDVPTRASRAFSGGLSRSNSVATGMARGPRTGGISLSRSNSVKSGQVESREALAERLKDVEAQRDALHNALKNLLERQEFQNRENLKKIRVLEGERERLLTSSPKKAGFEKEISSLRTEINVLRRRAEDALEQKWQVEKGLGGLKMDLDRAEEEIASLRALLTEKDILIPPSVGRSSNSSGSSGTLGVPVTSDSLRGAYEELQASYTVALERIKQLEVDTGNDSASEKTQLAIERLERSLASAVTERDAARKEATALLANYNGLAAGEAKNVETERILADELSASAHQIEQLAAQVRQQLSTNAELRGRLSDTVARGDNERKANYDRIAELQEHLQSLEEQLVSAQSASEDRVARHEEEIARLKEAHNEQLRRMDGSPSMGGMRSPALKSPRLLSNRGPSSLFARTSSLMQAKSFEEEAQIKTLKANVVELERALADAETEMQEVVAKMSSAQIEVLTLQEERETAVRETRRLQKLIEAEQVKSFEERFKTLSGNA